MRFEGRLAAALDFERFVVQVAAMRVDHVALTACLRWLAENIRQRPSVGYDFWPVAAVKRRLFFTGEIKVF